MTPTTPHKRRTPCCEIEAFRYLEGNEEAWAIEAKRRDAEAVAAERARLAEAVRGLVLKAEGFDEHDRWVTTGTVCGHVEGECGFRAAVLRLLEVEGS